MKPPQKKIPGLLQRFDGYLIRHLPNTWNTRAHYFLFFWAILGPVILLIAMLFPLSFKTLPTDAFVIGIHGMVIAVFVLVSILWIYLQYQRGIRSFHPVVFNLNLFIALFLFGTLLWSVNILEKRIARIIPLEEFEEDFEAFVHVYFDRFKNNVKMDNLILIKDQLYIYKRKGVLQSFEAMTFSINDEGDLMVTLQDSTTGKWRYNSNFAFIAEEEKDIARLSTLVRKYAIDNDMGQYYAKPFEEEKPEQYPYVFDWLGDNIAPRDFYPLFLIHDALNQQAFAKLRLLIFFVPFIPVFILLIHFTGQRPALQGLISAMAIGWASLLIILMVFMQMDLLFYDDEYYFLQYLAPLLLLAIVINFFFVKRQLLSVGAFVISLLLFPFLVFLYFNRGGYYSEWTVGQLLLFCTALFLVYYNVLIYFNRRLSEAPQETLS